MPLSTLQELAVMDADVRFKYLHNFAGWVRQLSHIAKDECRTKQDVGDAGITEQAVLDAVTDYNRTRFLGVWNNEPTVEEL